MLLFEREAQAIANPSLRPPLALGIVRPSTTASSTPPQSPSPPSTAMAPPNDPAVQHRRRHVFYHAISWCRWYFACRSGREVDDADKSHSGVPSGGAPADAATAPRGDGGSRAAGTGAVRKTSIGRGNGSGNGAEVPTHSMMVMMQRCEIVRDYVAKLRTQFRQSRAAWEVKHGVRCAEREDDDCPCRSLRSLHLSVFLAIFPNFHAAGCALHDVCSTA